MMQMLGPGTHVGDWLEFLAPDFHPFVNKLAGGKPLSLPFE